MIVFLSCVKTKQDHRCRADEMYISPLFKLSLRYAQSLNPRKIFILSAKYGLLELNDIIDPYELTLNHMGERGNVGLLTYAWSWKGRASDTRKRPFSYMESTTAST